MNPQAPNSRTQMERAIQLATLAFELGLVSRDQMCQALLDWVPQQEQSLSGLMVEAGYLSTNDRDLLDRLAQRHAESTAATDAGLEPIHQHLAAVTLGDSASPALREAAQTLSRTLRERSHHRQQPSSESSSESSKPDSTGAEEFVARGLTELNASSHRFRLLKPYAVGGLGVVSVAHDVELDREVAVKEIRPNATSDDAVQRFLLEARVTGQLDHPGIPPVYALGYFEDGRPFYVMRLIEGKTLKEAIAAFHAKFPAPDTSRERSLELRKLLGAMVSVCNTLRFAHSRNVLHRDIKPSNIMLGEYGETLVLDWGLAKNKEQSLPFSINDSKAHFTKRKADDPTQTGTGSVMGTPHYMSPEQARGEWESVNVRSDVYSVGATLYTLLTGRLPFSGATRDEVRDQVRQGTFKRPRQIDGRVPEALDAICVKAMALHREDRFANTGELASEIEHWLADEPVSSFRESAFQRWQRWVRARQSVVASLVLLMATGFVALTAGFIFVSSQFQTVKEATSEADRLNRQSQEYLTQARDLVLSYLLVDNDKRLALIPGTERVRMQMIDEAIRLLSKWSQAEPHNAQYQLNLAGAYRERHRIHRILHQPHAAWSDLMRALGIVEQSLMAGDVELRSNAIKYRHSLLNDATAAIMELGNDEASLQFAMEVRSRLKSQFDLRALDIAPKICIAEVNLSIAKLLLKKNRAVQAAELSGEAATLLFELLILYDGDALSSQLIGGATTVNGLIVEALKLEAIAAHELGDLEQASLFIASALDKLDDSLASNPDNQLNVENYLLLSRLKLIGDAELSKSTAQQTREKTDAHLKQTVQCFKRFPANRTIRGLVADGYVRKVDDCLYQGAFEEAINAGLEYFKLVPTSNAPSNDHQFRWDAFRLEIRTAEAFIAASQYEPSKLFLSKAIEDLLLLPLEPEHDYPTEIARLEVACSLLNNALANGAIQ